MKARVNRIAGPSGEVSPGETVAVPSSGMAEVSYATDGPSSFRLATIRDPAVLISNDGPGVLYYGAARPAAVT